MSYNQVTSVSPWVSIKYKNELNLTSLWFSIYKILVLSKNNKDFSCGIGLGNIKAEKNKLIENGNDIAINDNFLGYQILTKYSANHMGFAIKYSFVSTNNNWDGVNLGGITTTFNIYF
ncbi:MAG TPA: hypothetical protein DCX95_06290 [Elusimicrobia bacterium]|nr:hypothetical protein [Elusimicrobiota bacterium]